MANKYHTEYPLATILLSSYNRPRLIRDAIESVLAQTWPNIQLIIADDYSNAETHDVIDQYAMKWAHVVYPPTEPTDQERQFGSRCAICINAATKYAKGDFLVYLPDDDFLLPTGIESRARYLIEHPEVNVVFGRIEACKSELPVPGFHWLGDPMTLGSTYTLNNDHIHDRKGFWSADPVVRAANRIDHNMFMVRRVPGLPAWPEYPTQEWFRLCPTCGKSPDEMRRTAGVTPRETRAGVMPWHYEPWASSAEGCRAAFCCSTGETFDCPDAGFLFRCESAGLGPFYSVPDVVAVKRYTKYGHRSDPLRRE